MLSWLVNGQIVRSVGQSRLSAMWRRVTKAGRYYLESRVASRSLQRTMNILVLLIFANVVLSQQVHTFNTKISSPQPLWNATMTDKLKRNLLLNYDKFARPMHHNNVTNVTLALSIHHIDLDEFKNVITVHGWMSMEWMDDKLKWDSTQYEGLKKLHVADHEIWQPDIVLYNGAQGSAIDHYGNTHCIVTEEGKILWVPPAQFVAFCQLDLTLWPFDEQTCSLKFGSWTYDGTQIDLQVNQAGIDVELLVANSEWTVVKTRQSRNMVNYVCCPEPYIDVTYHLTMQRASPTYKAVIVSPAFVVMIMILASFFLPPNASEKVLLNVCTALVICLFLLSFSFKIPAMGNHTPHIVTFYSVCLYVVSFCLVGSVVVLWMSKTKHTQPLPWTIKEALTGPIGRVLLLGNYATQTRTISHRVNAEEMRDQSSVAYEDHQQCDEGQLITPKSVNNCQQDWVMFAVAIDRISFLFYTLLFIILALAYSL